MKIAEISTYSPSRQGGLETVVRELSRRFAQSHGIELYYRGDNETFGYGNPHPVCTRGGLTGHVQYNWRLARERFDADIIHAHGQNGAGVAFQDPEIPLIMTFHGTYAGLERVRNRQRRIPIWNPLTLFERYAGKQAECAVACSNQVKQELVEFYGIDPDNITVIHNGVDTDRFTPVDRDEAVQRCGMSPEPRYLGWIGSRPARKGLPQAIEVVQKLDGYRLLVAGQEGEDTENVTYLGYVPEDDITAFYSACDGLLFPTKYEGHPITVLEAFATSTPVITTEAANVEVGEKGTHYTFFEDIDVTDIPDFLARDRDFDFIEEHDWSRVAGRYEQLFDDFSG